MKRILFVCQGNVGRSQMAEGFYNHYTKSHDASSAGIEKDVYKRYPKLPKEIVQVMAEEGIDISGQTVKTLTKEMIDDHEKIVTICKREFCPGYLLGMEKNTVWEIEDPHYMGMDGIRKVRDRIRERVLEIVQISDFSLSKLSRRN